MDHPLICGPGLALGSKALLHLLGHLLSATARRILPLQRSSRGPSERPGQHDGGSQFICYTALGHSERGTDCREHPGSLDESLWRDFLGHGPLVEGF